MIKKPSRFRRPYLIRAYFDWIVDNQATPYLLVNADYPEVAVPREFIENNRIVLNISPEAVRDLSLSNDYITFGARFNGVHYDIVVPVLAVGAIYAKENGLGTVFEEEGDDSFPPGNNTVSIGSGSKGSRSHLKVVK